MSGPPEIALFFGRLHPLLVHLPIGLIVLLGILELLARSSRFKNANANAGLILALAVPVAVFTVLCGLLLSWAGGYQVHLLQWHKWTGIGTATACALAGLAYWLDFKKLYRFCLFSTLAALVVASHFGGSLTHGSDYLVRYAPAPFRALFGAAPASSSTPLLRHSATPIASLPAFAGVLQPVLAQECVACHGPNKSKAGLRLDSFASLLKGGKSGPAIVPGKSAESLLVKRLRLPPEDTEHMPPAGKPQPRPEELALLEWWIDAGAPAGKDIGDLQPPARIARILQARFGTSAPPAKALPPKPIPEVLPVAATLAEELNISILFLAQNQPWVQCNASIAGKDFGDAQLAALQPLAANLRWLDLGGTKVTDAGLAQLAAMPNLRRLHLEHTAVTDRGLARLAGLNGLEYLNLYGTAITDAGLAQLEALPNLKRLYLWQTKVTPAAAQAFAEQHTDQDQIQIWQEQIAALEAKIRSQHILVDVGAVAAARPETNSPATNPPGGQASSLSPNAVGQASSLSPNTVGQASSLSPLPKPKDR